MECLSLVDMDPTGKNSLFSAPLLILSSDLFNSTCFISTLKDRKIVRLDCILISRTSSTITSPPSGRMKCLSK